MSDRFDRPYLTAREAAEYVNRSMDAFYKWATRHGVKKYGGGRSLRFKRRDLDRALEQRDEPTPTPSTVATRDRMGELARRFAAGESIRA